MVSPRAIFQSSVLSLSSPCDFEKVVSVCVQGNDGVGGEVEMSNVLKAIVGRKLPESEASANASGCAVSLFVCWCSITLHLRTQ